MAIDFICTSNSFIVKDGATEYLKVESDGTVKIKTLRLDVITSTTALSGSASLPSGPVGFITVNIGGTDRKIPYYG